MTDRPDPVLVSRTGGVATVRMNRADKKNALTQAMYSALAEAVSALASDPAVKVAVLAGAPGAFCAGNDLQDFLANPAGGDDAPVIRFMRALADFPKPVIAAVDGVAVGIGVTLALHCDLVYAGQGARFVLPFTSLGIVPEYASTYLLPRIMGHARAMELLMFGEPFTAERACQAGLVNEVLPDGQVEARALERARRLALQPPQAMRRTKELSRRWTRAVIAEAIPLEAHQLHSMLGEPEAQEAMNAFMQKRKPDFSRFS